MALALKFWHQEAYMVAWEHTKQYFNPSRGAIAPHHAHYWSKLGVLRHIISKKFPDCHFAAAQPLSKSSGGYANSTIHTYRGVVLCFTKLWCHFEFLNLEHCFVSCVRESNRFLASQWEKRCRCASIASISLDLALSPSCRFSRDRLHNIAPDEKFLRFNIINDLQWPKLR